MTDPRNDSIEVALGESMRLFGLFTGAWMTPATVSPRIPTPPWVITHETCIWSLIYKLQVATVLKHILHPRNSFLLTQIQRGASRRLLLMSFISLVSLLLPQQNDIIQRK